MKTLAVRAATLLVSFAAVSTTRTAQAADDDPWFGLDKAEHFAAGSIIAGGGYALGTALWNERSHAILLGLGAALAAGAAKEALDATGLGHPSWKDFAWDAIGGLCGVGIAVTIDIGVHGGVGTLRF
jgi:putative lipoprotein